MSTNRYFTRWLIVIVLAVGALSLVGSQSAKADGMGPPLCLDPKSYSDPNTDYDTPVDDMMCWPMQPNTTVVIQGPRYMWGMRNVARYLDPRIKRLAIVSNVGVKCNTPQFQSAFCITVRKRVLPEEYWGTYLPNEGRFDGTATSGVITLNSRYNRDLLINRQHAAGHELLHALGVQHHEPDGYGKWRMRGAGLLSGSWESTLPSRIEMREIIEWYDTDCSPC